tara:strand:+ start:733 stop:984 length:252 start_codon:yes stop_codon:yes gene_type:complete
METTRFTGRGELIPRLIEQVGGDNAFALKMMQKNGFVDSSGVYTSKFHKRNNMTAGERALTRDDATAITHDYDITTNRTTQNA